MNQTCPARDPAGAETLGRDSAGRALRRKEALFLSTRRSPIPPPAVPALRPGRRSATHGDTVGRGSKKNKPKYGPPIRGAQARARSGGIDPAPQKKGGPE